MVNIWYLAISTCTSIKPPIPVLLYMWVGEWEQQNSPKACCLGRFEQIYKTGCE